MFLELTGRDFVRAWTTDLASTTSYTSHPATVTEPTYSATNGCIDLAPQSGGAVPLRVVGMVYEVGGSNNDVITFKLVGWKKVSTYAAAAGVRPIWVPIRLCELTCTMSSNSGNAGITNSMVGSTSQFCDTIVPVAAVGPQRVLNDATAAGTDLIISSPADDATPAWFSTFTHGCQKIQAFAKSASSVTLNALLSFY